MLYKVVQSLAKYPRMVNHSYVIESHFFNKPTTPHLWYMVVVLSSVLLSQSKYLVLSVNIQLKANVTSHAGFSSDEIDYAVVLMFDLVGEILLCNH